MDEWIRRWHTLAKDCAHYSYFCVHISLSKWRLFWNRVHFPEIRVVTCIVRYWQFIMKFHSSSSLAGPNKYWLKMETRQNRTWESNTTNERHSCWEKAFIREPISHKQWNVRTKQSGLKSVPVKILTQGNILAEILIIIVMY